MRKRNVAFSALCTLVLCVIFFLRTLGESEVEKPPSPLDRVKASPVARAPGAPASPHARPSPDFPDEPPKGELPEPEVAQAAAQLAWPGQRVVTCPAGTLAAGMLMAKPASGSEPGSVSFVVSDRGRLTAIVRAEAGEALLYEALQNAGRLTWTDATEETMGRCTVHPLRTFEVRGTVVTADGGPVEGAEVRGCLHGDLSKTDHDGAFTVRIAEGGTCHLMAFLDEEELFTRSETVEIYGDPSGLDAVVVTLWREGWTRAQQAALMQQMTTMLSQNLDQRTQHNAPEVASREASDEEVARLLWVWAGATQRQQDWMHDDLERLTGEDAELAFRDLWLNQY